MSNKLIKYPNNIKKESKFPKVSYANRGMTLESEINATNSYYLEKDIAVIHKKPTPIQVVEENKGKITKAYFKSLSTTDYNGLYQGYYIDFEAKETNSKTSFPLKNIHPHQLAHMKSIIKHQGISFIIIRFNKLNETYLIFSKEFFNYFKDNNKKSVPLPYFKENAYLLRSGLSPRIDYLKIINEKVVHNEKTSN